jgi:hypothetical protein
MKSKNNNNNNIEISETQIEEKQFVEDPKEPPKEEAVKPKKILSESQLEALSKARIKAQERKKELAELNAKSKGLKEQKLKADAAEYDKLQKKKELDETVKKIEVENPPAKIEKKKKIKKIIYEEDTEEESVEEVIVKRKPKQKTEKSYSELADMSLNEQIKKKLQEEKITCFFHQLTGKKF